MSSIANPLSLFFDADGILCLGVRFNVIDVVKKGNGYREEIKLSTTNASTKVEQTISSILGSRFLSGMTRVSIDLTGAIENNDSNAQWKVEGLVSKAPSMTARDGSFARESQFFSINGRPVEMPKVSRAIGDAWRAFEGNKKRPACVLCFSLPNNEYDVNLSPDKREVLLTHQDAVCSLIHDAVTKLWSSQNDGNFTQNAVHVLEQQPTMSTQQAATATSSGDASSPEVSPGSRRRFQRRNAFVHDPSMARTQEEREHQCFQYFHQPQNVTLPAASAVSPTLIDTVTSHIKPAAATHVPKVTPTGNEIEETTVTRADGPYHLTTGQQGRPSDEDLRQWVSVQSYFNNDSRNHQEDEIQALKRPSKPGESITPEETPFTQEDTRSKRRAPENLMRLASDTPTKRTRTLTLEDFAFRPANKMTKPRAREPDPATVTFQPNNDEGEGETETETVGIDKRKRLSIPSREDRRKRQKASESVARASQEETSESEEAQEVQTGELEETLVWNSFEGTDAVMKATKDARFSMRQFRKELRAISRSRHGVGENGTAVGGIDDFVAVDEENTTDNASQIGESKVVSLSKEDFRHMTVIGQFNLGFILAKCRNNHLWILDQHACDEKYNFERLCAATVIHEQTLIAPMPLELSPSEESCILDNMIVFEENGFRFAHDPDKPPRHRLSLTALPHSGAQDGRKAVQFGKEDVHALCAMLSAEEGYTQDGGTGADGSGMYGNNAVRRHAGLSQTQDTASKVVARLPKAIAMFANRACRGSIMIGTALSQKEMEAVVKRLADVESPWNCPHGRPTMRHVKDLMGIMMDDEQKAASLVAGPTMAVMTQNTDSQEEA